MPNQIIHVKILCQTLICNNKKITYTLKNLDFTQGVQVVALLITLHVPPCPENLTLPVRNIPASPTSLKNVAGVVSAEGSLMMGAQLKLNFSTTHAPSLEAGPQAQLISSPAFG